MKLSISQPRVSLSPTTSISIAHAPCICPKPGTVHSSLSCYAVRSFPLAISGYPSRLQDWSSKQRWGLLQPLQYRYSLLCSSVSFSVFPTHSGFLKKRNSVSPISMFSESQAKCSKLTGAQPMGDWWTDNALNAVKYKVTATRRCKCKDWKARVLEEDMWVFDLTMMWIFQKGGLVTESGPHHCIFLFHFCTKAKCSKVRWWRLYSKK